MALGILISIYICITLAVGVYSAKLVHSSEDYCLAGRKLSLILCSSTMFSTWFGSETIVGASSEFLQHGVLGIIEDPFGTSLCFILIGLFIAKPIYRLNLVTIVDFFRIKFGKEAERFSAIFMILSYIGWIAAQFLAMAIIFNVVLNIPIFWGVVLSTSLVCFYTIFGGMWSISINDFIQTLVIIFSLLYIGIYVYIDTDPIPLMTESIPPDFFKFFPNRSFDAWLQYITAWLTIGLGSIPQQDVFQRVISAKSEKVAIQSSYISGALYILVGMLPLFLTLAFKVTVPELKDIPNDQVLLQAILSHDSLIIKILFFGALLSAIMSSASGAILAPATILGENIIKPFLNHINDQSYLFLLRLCVFFTALVSGTYASLSNNVYYLVAESSIISLVSLFVPFVAGLYYRRANTLGALLSMFLGFIAWGLCLYLKLPIYAGLAGLLASFIGMILGSFLNGFKFKTFRSSAH